MVQRHRDSGGRKKMSTLDKVAIISVAVVIVVGLLWCGVWNEATQP